MRRERLHLADDGTSRRPPGSGVRVRQMMLFVATTALGLLGVRNCLAEMRLRHIYLNNVFNWLVLVSPLILSYSVAITVAGLLPPRPRLSALFRRPGFVVGWIAMLALVASMAHRLLMNPSMLGPRNLHKLFDYWVFWPAASDCGGGVLVAWMTLAAAGCWAAERSRIDRLGRALGAFWIMTHLAGRIAWMLGPW